MAEHVQAGSQNPALLQRLYQRLLVDDGATRNIDQHARRPQRIEHGGIDQRARGLAAAGAHHQEVDLGRQAARIAAPAIGNVSFGCAPGVGDVHAKGQRACCHCAADASQPDNAQTSA